MADRIKISIIGMGYVGLPLSLSFGNKFNTIGYDINQIRINNLNLGIDDNGEFTKKKITSSKFLKFSSKIDDIKDSNFYIICVPTPIYENKIPNIEHLVKSSKMISKILKKNDIVVYESTVYPGATEEICVTQLLKFTKLKYNKDFFVGYSPERINPGDKVHTIEKITKITSASNKNALKKINYIYKKIIKAGVFPVENIKIAEAAKVIENSQRDINVAFVNELYKIFNKLKIDTHKVLEAASTKWNFIDFKPGLVGGHCIGVDPYYLTYKSQRLGYNPKIILSGRSINNNMPIEISKKIKSIISKKIKNKKNIKILLLGLTFKENCNDVRNSKVFDIYEILIKYGYKVDVYDPYLSHKNIYGKQNIKLQKNIKNNYYDGAIVTVAHKQFKSMGINKLKKLLKKQSFIYDFKNIFSSNLTDNLL